MFRILMAITLVALALASTKAETVVAATRLVTKVEDTDDERCDNDCSLREAIKTAAAGDTIQFATSLEGRVVVLSGRELVVEKNLTIIGLGANRLAISGDGKSRVFRINSNVSVTISGMTIREGLVEAGLGENGGGGVLNQGALTLNRVHITGNRVLDDGGGALGGGIHNNGGALTINDSTISNNQVEDSDLGGCFGGGIANSGNLTLNNVTISGNTGFDAGNWCFGGGIDHSSGNLMMNFVTIADNELVKSADGDVVGGGLSSLYGQIITRNTIIAGNSPQSCDILVSVVSEGYNLEDGDRKCGFGSATDLVRIDPRLNLLRDNGGNTPTHVPQDGSPVIDVIPNGVNGCTPGQTTDQRGAVRAGGDGSGGAACDIGAAEYGSTRAPTAVTLVGMQAEEARLPAWIFAVLIAVSLASGIGLLHRIAVRRAAGKADREG